MRSAPGRPLMVDKPTRIHPLDETVLPGMPKLPPALPPVEVIREPPRELPR